MTCHTLTPNSHSPSHSSLLLLQQNLFAAIGQCVLSIQSLRPFPCGPLLLAAPSSTLHNTCRLRSNIQSVSTLRHVSITHTLWSSGDPRRLTHTSSGDPHSNTQPSSKRQSYASPYQPLWQFAQSLTSLTCLSISCNLSTPRSLAATFAPSDLRTLGSSCTLGINICSAAVAVPTILLAVAHSETFALTSNPTLCILVITLALSCFSCVHSWALPPTGGQWIPPLSPNVPDQASTSIWHQSKDESTNNYNNQH